MKIRKVAEETRPKIYALLQRGFPGSTYEVELVQELHGNNKTVHEWACLYAGMVIALKNNVLDNNYI